MNMETTTANLLSAEYLTEIHNQGARLVVLDCYETEIRNVINMIRGLKNQLPFDVDPRVGNPYSDSYYLDDIHKANFETALNRASTEIRGVDEDMIRQTEHDNRWRFTDSYESLNKVGFYHLDNWIANEFPDGLTILVIDSASMIEGNDIAPFEQYRWYFEMGAIDES